MGERERKKREGGGGGDNLFRRGINYSGIIYPGDKQFRKGDNLLRGIIYFVTLDRDYTVILITQLNFICTTHRKKKNHAALCLHTTSL